MKKTTLLLIVAFGLLLALVGWQSYRNKKLKEERNIYRENTAILLGETKGYKTKDSLNAVTVDKLTFKISEFQKWRSNDADLIKTLKVDNKRLESVSTVQLQTIHKLRGTVRDSLIYLPGEPGKIDTLRCITIVEKWFSLDGCIDKNKEFTGEAINRESLLYTEHITPKRFLFFKWGIKDRKQEIVSRNPGTDIIKAEFITIRK